MLRCCIRSMSSASSTRNLLPHTLSSGYCCGDGIAFSRTVVLECHCLSVFAHGQFLFEVFICVDEWTFSGLQEGCNDHTLESRNISFLFQYPCQELIVVHNLRNTSDVTEATMLFKQQVMQSYDGEISHLGRLIFTADLGDGVPPVHHIGLCYEFSTAGDEFNAKSREYLLQSGLVLVSF